MVIDFKENIICPKPWTSLDINTKGEYRPCCLFSEPIKDEKGNPYSIEKDKIYDVMNSNYMINLRNDFLKNKKNKNCEKCWYLEEENKKSLRKTTWEKFPLLAKHSIKKNLVNLIDFHVGWGNTCNLKCRICGYQESSQFASEEIKLNKENKELIKIIKEYNKKASWPKKNKFFINELDKILPNVRIIQNVGGEPFLSQEHYTMLQKIIDLGIADKVHLHYNTNGTIYPTRAIKEFWNKFKSIELLFSIDDINNRFEYQRHPALWAVVKDNLFKIKNLEMKNISLQIYTVVSTFNIFYLNELSDFIDFFKPNYWEYVTLYDPLEFDTRAIPRYIKDKISKKFEKHMHIPVIRDSIERMNYKDITYPDWKEKIKKSIFIRDKIRSENFAKTFPELYSLIQ